MPSSHYTSNLVLVQKKQATTGAWNNSVAWVEDRQVWVSIVPNRGREVFAGAELDATVTHTIRGDFLELEGIDETYRIVYNDTHDYSEHGIRADSLVFDLLAVMPDYDVRDDIMIQANLKSLRYGDLTSVPE